jgi:hypothetical protein
MHRVKQAFEALGKVTYSGDPMLFQSKFMAALKELDSVKASIVDYKFCMMMKAFDGKSKSIQFKIAEDFNGICEIITASDSFTPTSAKAPFHGIPPRGVL